MELRQDEAGRVDLRQEESIRPSGKDPPPSPPPSSPLTLAWIASGDSSLQLDVVHCALLASKSRRYCHLCWWTSNSR